MGLVGFHLVPFALGGDQVKMDAAHFAASPLAWLRQIDRRRSTVTSCPDFGLHHVVQSLSPHDLEELDLSCVRRLFNGAEPISAAVMRRFLDLVAPARFRAAAMYPVYGLADATLGVTFSPPDVEPAVRRVDADRLAAEWIAGPPRDGAPAIEYLDVGYPLRSVAIRITDPLGRVLPDGHLGEVQIRGAAVAGGYEGSAGAPIDAEGWLGTGDVGFPWREGSASPGASRTCSGRAAGG
jgi:acyl-CoA synthetase (AMP-forming)/AMP-acid ligase II